MNLRRRGSVPSQEGFQIRNTQKKEVRQFTQTCERDLGGKEYECALNIPQTIHESGQDWAESCGVWKKSSRE